MRRVVSVAFTFTIILSLHAVAIGDTGTQLLFWDVEDIKDSLGTIRFGAELLENEGKAEGYPDMQYGCEVPQIDGSTWIYGW